MVAQPRAALKRQIISRLTVSQWRTYVQTVRLRLTVKRKAFEWDNVA